MALTPEQLAELETQHGDLLHLHHQDGKWEVVFRKPKRSEYKRFRQQIGVESTKADAQEILCRTIVVYPSREAFDALLEDYPMIPDSPGVTAMLSRMMSGEVAAAGK